MIRPKHTAPDDNHYIVRDYLAYKCGGYTRARIGKFDVHTAYRNGMPVMAIDTHDLGGVFGDWIVAVGCAVAWVEVKTPVAYAAQNNSLRPLEEWTRDNLAVLYRIVYDDGGVEDLFDELAQMVLS